MQYIHKYIHKLAWLEGNGERGLPMLHSNLPEQGVRCNGEGQRQHEANHAYLDPAYQQCGVWDQCMQRLVGLANSWQSLPNGAKACYPRPLAQNAPQHVAQGAGSTKDTPFGRGPHRVVSPNSFDNAFTVAAGAG